MTISIEMTGQEVAALKELTHRESDAEAVAHAAREYLRLSRLRELKAASGKVEFGTACSDASVYSSDPHFDVIPDLKRFEPAKKSA